MKAFCVAALCCVAMMSVSADVVIVEDKPFLDGSLDEPCWTAAHWNGPFVKLANQVSGREVKAQTCFSMLADSKTLYVAVKCHEPEMSSLKDSSPHDIWHGDHIEVFLSPRGDGFAFYQFSVPFDPRNGFDARYASEGGNISPDPYGPEWSFACAECDGGWCVEMAIPLSSLYMTRNAEWCDTWKVNVARQREAGAHELTTWSPLQSRFSEPDNFLVMQGFPARADADDVGITGVVAICEYNGRAVGSGRECGSPSLRLPIEWSLRRPT